MGECMCGVHQEWITPWMVDPCGETIWWFSYAVGGIFLTWFWSICPLKRKGQCKSTSYSEWSPLLYDETFLSWWEWSLHDDHALTWRAEGVTEWFDECNKVGESYAITLIVTSSQPMGDFREGSPPPPLQHQMRECLLKEWYSFLQ